MFRPPILAMWLLLILLVGLAASGGWCSKQDHIGAAPPEPPPTYVVFASHYGFQWDSSRGDWVPTGLIGNPTAFGIASYSPQMKIAATPLWLQEDGTWGSRPFFAGGTVLTLQRGVVPTYWRPENVRQVTVVVADSCPGCGEVLPRVWLDLSPAAYRVLAPLKTGLVSDVFVEVQE